VKIQLSDLKMNTLLGSLLPNRLMIVGAVFSLISIFFYLQDPHHFYPAYLTSFVVFLSLTLGSLFFVLIMYLTRAGWGVVVRRVPECMMKNVGLMFLFFIPIIFGIHDLYHWSHHDAVAQDPLLQIKLPYLNSTFFVIRSFFFFGIWYWLSNRFFYNSVNQDTDTSPNLTLHLQKISAVAMLLYAVTQSFGFIDYVMSLTPHWYSTIFGLYMFAGSIVCCLAVVSVMYMLLRRYGMLTNIVSVEHYHDLGKLLYGFNVFWSYIAFSQFFLIWYANVPEETVWFAEHFHGSWNSVAVLLAVGHFAIPFLFFMSRHAKRNLPFHCGMALWIVFIHIVDVYWLINPTFFKDGFHLQWADITCLIAMGAFYFAFFFKRLNRVNLIPCNDPRLHESLKFKNY
tara:strand:- start:277 stop:1467 length:1191 start_codon:yes stop_codon:yes gene_type:complete